MSRIKLKYNIPQIKKICTSAHLLICTLLLVSCAQIVAPGGGAKDIEPPKVLKYSPDSAQLQFSSKIITITFDEFVQLKDLNNQLLISPPLEKTPEISVKNKTLFIELDKNEVLKANTTYSISFGNAVQDLNENNAIENFKYIFSTGNFIDSLTLKGKVQKGFDQSTEKGILVMLYSDHSDSVVYKSQPDYFAKTEKDGSFQINNIKTGKYKVVAVKDANTNYKYDGDSESIGFSDTLIDVTQKNNILLRLFQEPAKKVYLKKYIHDSYGKVSFFFNQGSDSIRILPLNNDQKGVQEFTEYSRNNDTLTYWIKNFIKDSLILQVSNGNKVLDTVSLKFIKLEDALKSKRNPLKLRVVSSPDGNQSFDLGSELKFMFNHPISSYATTPMLLEDTILLRVDYFLDDGNKTVSFSFWDSTSTTEDPNRPGVKVMTPTKNIYSAWKENTKYHLLILPGTVTDYFGLTNDSIKIDFKTREEKYYGSVEVNLSLPSGDLRYILQLLDESGNIVREDIVRKSIEISYQYLAPKKYKLKLISDDNANGKWDSGNYLKKIQPEKVIYNTELINIRSNWDAELDWRIE
ncbi:MAG: Ig-like domain-containing protein [Bacteroidetes bacterium]|nr:Ig-like domain-containing protein [Bacteroidota bacterium]